MTDKPTTEKPVIDPFKNVKAEILMDKIVKYPQGHFLHELFNRGGFATTIHNKDQGIYVVDGGKVVIPVIIHNLRIEQKDAVYVCRMFTVLYQDEKPSRRILFDEALQHNPRSYRRVDILIVGPQGLMLDVNHVAELDCSLEDCLDKNYINLEFNDAHPQNTSQAFDKKCNLIPLGHIEKDVNKIPASFFFKEAETFTIKLAAKPNYDATYTSDFYIRLGYLPTETLGLN